MRQLQDVCYTELRRSNIFSPTLALITVVIRAYLFIH